MNVLQARDDLLHVRHTIVIRVAQHHDVSRHALRNVDRAVVRHDNSAGILEPFGKALNMKSGRNSQSGDALIRGRQTQRLG
jgi:hypothetical protein